MSDEARTIVLDPMRSIPVAKIRPGIEVLLALTPNEDGREAEALWDYLCADIIEATPFVLNERPGLARLTQAQPEHHNQLCRALHMAGRAPGHATRIGWAVQRWVDVESPDALPEYSRSCTFGWLDNPGQPRGCALELTLPLGTSWSRLLELTQQIMTRWSSRVCWITVGYRFVPLLYSSVHFERSLTAIMRRAARLPAVDVGDPLALHTTRWQQHLRTINWCTAVGPSLAARLPPASDGTTPTVDTQASAIGCESIAGARIYQAGAEPTLGDTNRREDISAYRTLDEQLRPVRTLAECGLSPWIDGPAWLDRWAGGD